MFSTSEAMAIIQGRWGELRSQMVWMQELAEGIQTADAEAAGLAEENQMLRSRLGM